MSIWSAEIKELERLFESFKGKLPELEKELGQLIQFDDPNVILLYSRRCLEVIITDLCECELNRERGSEPLKSIIDKLNKEKKIPSHIASSMYGLNELSTYGAHPKDFDPEQVKPVLINLDIIIKWYLKNRGYIPETESKSEEKRVDGRYMEPSKAGKSIAVLPFVNMSPEKDQDYFCDGITEEIINALTHIKDLKVIARTSAFAFKDKQIDIREIGRILNVETLLEGSIRKAGNQLRITAQLIKVTDGSHIWSERYDRELKDVFVIQDEISMAVANMLKLNLLGEEKTGIVKRHTEDLESYNDYLMGNYYMQMSSAEGYKKAIWYYEQMLKRNPNNLLGYVKLAEIGKLSSFMGNSPPNETYPRAIRFLQQALEIDNAVSEAHALLGILEVLFNRNWKDAEKEFKQALSLNKNSAYVHQYYSLFLTYSRDYERAVAEAKIAVELDPLSCEIIMYMGEAFFYAHQMDKAIEQYQKAITMAPNYTLSHYLLGHAYEGKALYNEAIKEYQIALDLSDSNSLAVSSLACLYYLVGEKDKAGKLYSKLEQRSKKEYVPPLLLYSYHLISGDYDLALDWLEKAIIENDSYLLYYNICPTKGHHFPDEPRFNKMINKAGLK